MFKLPTQNIWKKINVSDKFFDLVQTFNVDLTSKLGSLLASPRMLLAANTTDLENLGQPPAAFRFFTTTEGYLYCIADDRVFVSNGGPNGTWAESSGSPTTLNSDFSDLEQLGAYLFVTPSTSQTIRYINSSAAWASATNSLTNSSGLHAMTRLPSTDRLYIIDGNSTEVSSIGGTTLQPAAAATQYTLNDLVDGTSVQLSWIKANSSRVYIGTIFKTGRQSVVFELDGSQSSGPNKIYILDAPGSLSCVIQDEVPVILDVYGRLLKLSSNTFVELDQLPFANKPPITYFANPTLRLCHHNGLTLNKGKINVLVNTQLNDTNSTLKEGLGSGIWEYTPETGFYLKSTFGRTKSNGTIVDYGSQKLSRIGALTEIDAPSNAITQGSINGRLLAGVRYFTDATTTTDGIFYDDTANTLQNGFSCVTKKFYCANITDLWQKIYVILGRKFLSSTDKIVVKCRVEENDITEATITYTSTTQFTVPTASFTTAPAVGDEVFILSGVGAGRAAHITTVTTTAPNYVITVDETITGATTQTAKVHFQTWKKMGAYSAQTDSFFKLPFPNEVIGSSPWIQIKIWGLFSGANEIASLIISNKAQELIE